MDRFVESVADAFGLGALDARSVEPMAGSANRLWRLQTQIGEFVLKEFPYDRPEHLPRRRSAAAFERSVFDAGSVVMPEPLRSNGGELVAQVIGSRGEPSSVRLHRWMDRDQIWSVDASQVRLAGVVLQEIQKAGALWSVEPTGSIRWWDVEPIEVVDRLARSELASVVGDAAAITRDALGLISAAEGLEGPWIYSHCDHKPENALAVRTGIAVLDWDECGHCHPQLEAVEAALRWSGATPCQDRFAGFLEGYSTAGGSLGRLSEPLFGKWIAALLGWFCFQSRRALGEWSSESADERRQALSMALDSMSELKRSLATVSIWAKWH